METEIKKNPSNEERCRCCHQDDQLTELWSEYLCDGERENYGEMLAECYGLQLQYNETEQICWQCVVRLREAYSFRKMVFESDPTLQTVGESVDVDKSNVESFYLTTESAGETKIVPELGEILDEESEGTGDEENDDTIKSEEFKEEYMEIEYLEDDQDGARSKPRTIRGRSAKATYKNYTDDDLRQCMEAVKTCRLSRSEAAKLYNIPIKTLGSKLRTDAMRQEGDQSCVPYSTIEFIVPDLPTQEDATDDSKHYTNIQTILQNSNATPLKGYQWKGFECCFCSKRYPEPNKLKQHNLMTHKNDIKNFMKNKPSSDLSVKLDITDLSCTCGKGFNSLDVFTDHLISKHDKTFYKDIPKQILPFVFNSQNFNCCLCNSEFYYFKNLFEHMSEHFSNYECDLCERVFVTKSSLRVHRYRHETGEFRCKYCGKTFNTKVKRREHERTVHVMQGKPLKCCYCIEYFHNAPSKNRHENLQHGADLKTLKCKACDMVYRSQRSLTEHLNNHHLMIKPFKCCDCEKSFNTKNGLNRHSLVHSGIRNYQCEICPKRFKRVSALVEHTRIHKDDRRFHCDVCGERFIRKISLINHFQKQHADWNDSVVN